LATSQVNHSSDVIPGFLRCSLFAVLAILLGCGVVAEEPRPALANDGVTDRKASDSNTQRPTLVIGRTDPKRAGEPFPLEVSARDLKGGGFVVISGLASGTGLSVGDRLGDNSWWVAAANLEHVTIEPPSRFVGAMDIIVELRLADTGISDRKNLHLEWLPVASLDADELKALLKRGNDLIISGDIAAAQLVLRRAADAGSAQAAMTLAATYDPVQIAKLGAHGFSPDVVLARQWYEKAKQFGSIEATRRLEMMAVKRD
jgi:hypothetical protein